MILLDCGCHDARYTDAVAAHHHRDFLALLVQHGGLHGLAVAGAELKYVSDLDAARNGQRAIAIRAGIAVHRIAQVGRFRFRQVTPPVDTAQMFAILVGAADKVGQRGGGKIDNDRDSQPDRPQ